MSNITRHPILHLLALVALPLAISSSAPSAIAQTTLASNGSGPLDNHMAKASLGRTKNPASPDFVVKKTISTNVRDGILTVDGLVVKARLNYDIQHAPCLYFFLPGIGTAIVSREQIPNSLPQQNAFHGNDLTIDAFGHLVELSSTNPLVDKKNETAWVALDPSFIQADRMPMMGFGNTLSAPYQWPGAKRIENSAFASTQAPPLPRSLRPRMEDEPATTEPAPQSQSGKQ